MEYISVGTNSLISEYSYQIINSLRTIKPTGGLWCSAYYESSFIEWIDYITRKATYYTIYISEEDPFKINGVIVTLKEGTRLFELVDKEHYDELAHNYKFDFRKLEQDYDGMIIAPFRIKKLDAETYDEFLRLYCVKTLNVFDLSSIDYYRKTETILEPFDYTDFFPGFVEYETTIDEQKKYIKPISKEYLELLDFIYQKIKDFVYHLRISHPDYSEDKLAYHIKNEIWSLFADEIKEYVSNDNLDEERITNSLAIRTLKKVN